MTHNGKIYLLFSDLSKAYILTLRRNYESLLKVSGLFCALECNGGISLHAMERGTASTENLRGGPIEGSGRIFFNLFKESPISSM
jgi:hypothetical protein